MRKCVKNYQEEKYIQKIIGKTASPVEIETAKICVLKHICIGINSSPKGIKKMDSINEFKKDNPELMKHIDDYPALFTDRATAELLGHEAYPPGG